jgi:D-alanyl-D-alanine carboxypeptidase (penicillin-binding protein 5/6)
MPSRRPNQNRKQAPSAREQAALTQEQAALTQEQAALTQEQAALGGEQTIDWAQASAREQASPARRRIGLTLTAVGLGVALVGSAAFANTTRHLNAPATTSWQGAGITGVESVQPSLLPTLSASPSTDPSASASASPSSSAPVALPGAFTVPGSPPQLPWPSTGQYALEITGIGSFGASPNQQPVSIASVTKVMTAYLVLHDHPMSTTSNGSSLTVSLAEAAAYPSEVAKEESLVKVNAGEVLTERQALEALMLPSADNIALILARWDAGSVTAFLTKMNNTAAAFGMKHTHYTDPSGYDAATRSTANDQLLLARRAMQLSTFAQIVGMSSATIPVAGVVHNYNSLLGTDGIVGLKTGSTSAAGGCLLFAAHYSVGGRTVTILGAVFGQHGATMYGLPQALTASRGLVEAAEGAVQAYTPVEAGKVVVTRQGLNLVASKTITVVGWAGLKYRTKLHSVATLHAGDYAGSLELTGPGTKQTVTLTAR